MSTLFTQVTELESNQHGKDVFELANGITWDTSKMDNNFYSFFSAFYSKFGERVYVTSAFRETTNKIEADKKAPGSHNYGKAIDIKYPKFKNIFEQYNFIDWITGQFGFKGIGLYNWGIHLDYGYSSKTSKRAWAATSTSQGGELASSYDEMLKKLLLWRGGLDYKTIDGKTVSGLTDSQFQADDEDSAEININFTHPEAVKNKEIVEIQDFDSINDAQFTFDNGRLLFGDMYLHVPPISINISSHNKTLNFETIRTAGNPILSVDQEIVNINMNLFFANEESINNELRRIIAMYIRTPFIPIENEFINKILKKHYDDETNTAIPVALNAITISTVPGFPNSLQASLTLNEMEHRILINQLKYLMDDSSVESQNNQFSYYGNKEGKDFDDKISVRTTTRPYKSLPFMKYYQALLYNNEKSRWVLDPNGNPLKDSKGQIYTVYDEDRTYYNKKYLAPYKIDKNKTYILEYYEIKLDVFEERKKNRSALNDRLTNLTRIQNLLNESGKLEWYKYNPNGGVNGVVGQVFNEFKDYVDNFGNGWENFARDFTIHTNDPMVKEMYDMVIKPELFKLWPNLKNVNTGETTILINDQKPGLAFNIEGKNKTFIEFLAELNLKYNHSTDVDNPVLHQQFTETISQIFNYFAKQIKREVDEQTVTYMPKKQIVIGNDDQSTTVNITATFSNKLLPMHIEYWTKPAYQHLGSNNWEFTMSVKTTDLDLVGQIREMVEKYRETAKKVAAMRSELFYKGAAYIDFSSNPNSLLNTLGINHAVITDYMISSVEGQPNLFDIVLKFTQADLTIDSIEKPKSEKNSPDKLLAYLKNIFKRCAYDSESNTVHIMKINYPTKTNIVQLIQDDFDSYITSTFYDAISKDYKYKLFNNEDFKYPFEEILNFRKRREKVIKTITDPVLVSIIRDYNETLAETIKQQKDIQFWKQWSNIMKNFLIVDALVLATVATGGALAAESVAVVGTTMIGGGLSVPLIEKMFKNIPGGFDLFSKTYYVVSSYFSNLTIEAKILELLYDPSFKEVLQQFDDEFLMILYNDFKKSSLTPNYPDLYLPIFDNDVYTTKSSIFTPPDFYYKSYSFIDKTFVSDIEDLVNNQFDIEASIALLNGRITYEKYLSVKDYIDKNKVEFDKTFGAGSVDKLTGKLKSVKEACDKYYKELYAGGPSITMDSDTIIPIVQAEEYFNMFLKNISVQQYKQNVTSKQIPDGSIGKNIIKNADNINNYISKELSEDDAKELVKNPDNIAGGLSRGLIDTIYLNKVPNDSNEKTKALQSYWGFGTKVADEELKRLNRIYNARTNSNILRMGRAFPTFKIYFIEQDKNEWLFFDDFYSYSAINSIETIANKNTASKTAVIKLSNLSNRLTNDKVENLNSEKSTIQNKNPMNEQKLESLMLKPGCNIMIKIGYSNNPLELDTVFQGVITEVQPGPVIEIVCQSYGNQLNNTLETHHFNWNSLEKGYGDIVTWILNKIPGLNKLGKYSPIMFGQNDSLRNSGNLWFRGIQGKYNIASFFTGVKLDNFNTNDPRDDNIFLQYSLDKGITDNLTFDWKLYNQTAWEAIQEILLYHPDYIAQVLPYNENMQPGVGDIRETLYIGPKDGAYKYTDMYGYQGGLLEKITWEKLFSNVKTTYATMNEFYIANFSNKDFGGLEFLLGKIEIKDEYKVITGSFVNAWTTLESFLDSKYFEKDEDRISYNVAMGTHRSFNLGDFKDQVRWFQSNMIKFEKFINNTNSRNLKRDVAIQYLFNQNWKLSPQFKPVREDHIINSFYHIIKNNITANADAMYNNVIMTFPKSEPVFSEEQIKIKDENKDLHQIEVCVDDDIDDEFKRTYHSFQKNIDTNMFDLLDSNLKLMGKKKFWVFGGNKPDKFFDKVKKSLGTTKIEYWQKYPTYMRVAMNILAKQMERMYTGELVIWGNSRIKPWDVIHLDDIINDMKGSFEVEQVIHRFDTESGFITIITPNLITHVQNPDLLKDESVVNEIMRIASIKGITSALGNTILPLDPGVVGLLGALPVYAQGKVANTELFKKSVNFISSKSTTASSIFSTAGKVLGPAAIIGTLLYGAWKGLSSYSDSIFESVGKLYGRNAIWFSPMKFKGEPYIAGLEGYKENTFMQHIIHKMNQGPIIQRIGFSKYAMDAYLLDGNNVDISTYLKTIVFGKK